MLLELPACCCTGLLPYYEHLCAELGWAQDVAKVSEMQAANEQQLAELGAKIKVGAVWLC
jgi:hypothetical protein